MYKRILVPVDGSQTSNAALDEAIRFGERFDGTLRLVHVLDELAYATGFESAATYVDDVIPRMHREGERILQMALGRTKGRVPRVETCLLDVGTDRTATRLIGEATAWHADLIVIGTHGRRGFARWTMGSDAEQVARSSPVPVLLIRTPEAPHSQ